MKAVQDYEAILTRLAERLGHSFQDPRRLRDALTHRSFVNEQRGSGHTDNERLELVGDAILDLAASWVLFHSFPEAKEGELSRRRADLVCEPALAKLARELELGEGLRLGRGEELSGGRDKPRLLASALEACIAAVALDAGIDAGIEMATRLIEPHLDALAPGARDFKSRLQERLQALGQPTPVYQLVGTEGPEHARVFEVALDLGEGAHFHGRGRSKLRAEQEAAALALAALDEEGSV